MLTIDFHVTLDRDVSPEEIDGLAAAVQKVLQARDVVPEVVDGLPFLFTHQLEDGGERTVLRWTSGREKYVSGVPFPEPEAEGEDADVPVEP